MNENTNAVREAQYAKAKAEYDAAMLRHRELMSRRAAAKRGELHEQFAQAAEAAEDDDASTSSKEERPPRHFLQADFEAQARHPESVQHSRCGGCPIRTARAARAAFAACRNAPFASKQMEHRCLRSMARHARVEGQGQVQVQAQVQVQVHGHAPVV